MNRVPLVCPLLGMFFLRLNFHILFYFLGCHAPVFSRPGALEVHVAEIHQEIIGLPLASSLFLPSWIPSPWTTEQVLTSPNLPTSVCPAEILAGACGGKWNITKVIQQPRDIQPQFPQASPKKYQKPGPLSNHGGKVETIIFADLLTGGSDKHGMWVDDLHANCLIQGMGIHIDLSRPQSMFPPDACIHKVPPKTIHYKVFEQRLEILEREDGKNESLV